MKQKLKSGDEIDAILSRKWYSWRRGSIKKIKRALNKRIRKEPIDVEAAWYEIEEEYIDSCCDAAGEY